MALVASATNVGRKKLDPGSMRLLDVPAEGDVVFKKGDSVGLALWEDAMDRAGRFCNHSFSANAECEHDNIITKPRLGLVPIKSHTSHQAWR